MCIDMEELTVTAAEACDATDCVPSTLRAWHNRVGLLAREGGGWRRYSFADLIAIRLMVILTSRGMKANEAADIVQKITPEIQKAASGGRSKIAIGRMGPEQKLAAEKIDPLASAMTALNFDDEYVQVVDLGSIAVRLHFAIQRIRNHNTEGK